MNLGTTYKINICEQLIKQLLVLLCFVFIPGFSGVAYAEGTKQLEPPGAPSNSVSRLVLSQNFADNRIPFALLDCNPDYRLNVNISDHTTENIYLGFGSMVDYFDATLLYTDVNYRIKDPSGKVVSEFPLRLLPRSQGNPGFINTRSQAEAGPNINGTNPDGYTPLILDPLMNGDYVIEFQLPSQPLNALRVFKYIDISVAMANTVIPGRLWSKTWQLGTGSVTSDINATYSLFYIYTSDSIVTRFDCNGLAGGVWTIYSNEWGCSTNGSWSERRQSTPGNATVIPQYKIFLNDPDPLVYPSGHIGQMIDFKILKEECDTVITFATHVSKGGNIEIMLDTPPLNPGTTGPEDVQLGYNVTAGYNVLLPAWDGKNKFGVPVENGTQVYARISFLNGLSNVPLYDVEDTPRGFKVDIQRPAVTGSTKLKLFWDDTKLNPRFFPTKNTTDGCIYPGSGYLSGCHPWTRYPGLGDTNTINTWWYLTTDQVLDKPLIIKIKPSSGSISGTVNVCDGQEVQFRTSGIPYARKYIWHISGTGGDMEFERNAPDTALTYRLPLSWDHGNYMVSVFGRNPQCFDGEKVKYPFNVHDPPNANFIHTNPCQGAEIIFTDRSVISDAALNKFSWTVNSAIGDERSYIGNPARFVFDAAAIFDVSLIVTDQLGCADTTTSIITVKPKPVSSFEYTVNPERNDELYLANNSAGASDYLWNFGNGIASKYKEPVIQYDREGDYGIMLIATDKEGCKDTAIRRYYYMPGLWMPNAFTPDNNGQNDIFKPVTQRTTLEPYKLLIFNRWGQLVFESADPARGWDGKLNGKPCPAGNYSYLLQYREAEIYSTGIITLRGMLKLIR